MLNKIEQIEDVFNFRIFESRLFYYSEGGTSLSILEKSFTKQLEIHQKIKEVFFVFDKILIIDNKNRGYWLINDSFSQIPFFTFDSVSESMGVSISTKWISYNPIAIENSLFDIKTLQKKWTKPILNLRIEKDILFSLQESFSFFDIKTGNYLWSFLLSDSYNFYRKSNYENTPDDFCQAEIVRIIGEYNNILWIVLNSGRLLGLEVETGKLKYDLIKPINFIEEIDGFDVALWAMIDIEKGQIFGIKKHCYFEIDLKNSQESYYFYDISETCQQHQIEADYPSYELVWEGDEIFIGKNELHYDKHPCNVGIFNRITKQITWTSRELKNENIFKGISKIEYANNKLFVLDRESTLHIFER